MVWYVSAGRSLPEAEELHTRMGEWYSEWSLRHMVDVLRRAIVNAHINPDSANEPQMREMVKTLKNWANLAARRPRESAKGQLLPSGCCPGSVLRPGAGRRGTGRG